MRICIEDQEFSGIEQATGPLQPGEYQNCIFRNSDFSQQDLTGFKFIDCRFESCHLSMAVLQGVSLRDTRFEDCKMMGLFFDQCNPYAVSCAFVRCILDHSSFYEVNIKRTPFTSCSLKGVDFNGSDLSQIVFDHCDLEDAKIENALLIGTDFRTAVNYRFNLGDNKVKGAKFSLEGLPGLLSNYDIEIE